MPRATRQMRRLPDVGEGLLSEVPGRAISPCRLRLLGECPTELPLPHQNFSPTLASHRLESNAGIDLGRSVLRCRVIPPIPGERDRFQVLSLLLIGCRIVSERTGVSARRPAAAEVSWPAGQAMQAHEIGFKRGKAESRAVLLCTFYSLCRSSSRVRPRINLLWPKHIRRFLEHFKRIEIELVDFQTGCG